MDGGLAVIEDKKIPVRATPIVPPGAWSARHFARHCTACQLCVSACPNNVLRPSTELAKLMQPEMSYERGVLPSGVYALLRCVSDRGNPSDYRRGEIIRPHRACRMD